MYFADLFSGDGGVARAVRRLGGNARSWDICHGHQYDLTAPAVQRFLAQEAHHGRLAAAMLAPPCASFGPAGSRRRPLQPSDRPWGLPPAALSEREQQRLQVGNATLKAALTLMKAFTRAGVPWIFEHPHSSFAF